MTAGLEKRMDDAVSRVLEDHIEWEPEDITTREHLMKVVEKATIDLCNRESELVEEYLVEQRVPALLPWQKQAVLIPRVERLVRIWLDLEDV